MELLDLYNLAEQKNIEVIETSLPNTGSLSVMSDNGNCYIGIDQYMMDNEVLERVHLAHELGHCETGSFYNIHATIDYRQRHENRADKWAVQQLVPADALKEAFENGYTELWELAEHFGITEEYIRKAVCLYVHGNLATELYLK